MKFKATFEIEMTDVPEKDALGLAQELAYEVVSRHRTAMLDGQTKEIMKANDPVTIEVFDIWIKDAEKMLKSLKVESNG